MNWDEVVAALSNVIVLNGEQEGTQSVWDQPGDPDEAHIAAEWIADWMLEQGLIGP